MASGEAPSESLKYKLLVFKVSIHCEGCKKKVKKILANIPGVYDTEIDARQHKVTVKASTDAETILRRLEKSGKHASIWPLPDKKPGYQSSKDGGAGSKKKDAVETSEKEEKEKPSPNPSESNSPSVAPTKPSEESKIDSLAKSPAESEKLDAKTGETIQKPAARVESNEKNSAAGEADNAKGGGKKKERKTKKEKESVGTSSDSATVNPPPPPTYSYPTQPAPPPQPAYAMAYNMAQPSHSQTYYAPPPPASTPQDHVYMSYPPPPEFQYYGSTDLSSLGPMQLPPPPDMFSDDNPNACNLM
ncbi:heavy metal-associated isoprenylated plant protein 35-like [Zingiber officinale]|uniref:heavy metal-associated isoprenylated plant protein 35-like n=1 Tax=Zingiber officinale TaxID=94328 RepID=UPI001C4D8264|nr:heavy metal-associated isoprenylated plant protein 35-like [Zingiber officinale]